MAERGEDGMYTSWDGSKHTFEAGADVHNSDLAAGNTGNQSSSSSSSSSSSGPLVTHFFDPFESSYKGPSAGELAEWQAASNKTEQIRTMYIIKVIRFYNAGDWDAVLKVFDEVAWSGINGRSLQSLSPLTKYIQAITFANRKGDYITAFSAIGWKIKSNPGNDDEGRLYQRAVDEGKKAWELANGRAKTEADFTQAGIDYREKNISEFRRDRYSYDEMKNWDRIKDGIE
jgi:hypothetical protein